jgi:hypothetical protein
MTVPISPAAPPLPPQQDGSAVNLFEWAMSQANSGAAGSGLDQVAQGLMTRLDAFMGRSREFSAQVAEASPATPAGAAPSITPAANGAPTPPAHVDQALGALRLMFDHSIETQLVVRSATQMSGSVNTLLKGQ